MAPSKKSSERRAPPPDSPPCDPPLPQTDRDVFGIPLPPVDHSLSPTLLPRRENPPHLFVEHSPPAEPDFRGRSRGRQSRTPPPVDAMRVMERMMQSQHDFLDRQMRANDDRQAAMFSSFHEILSSTIAAQPRGPSSSSVVSAPKIRMADPDIFDRSSKMVETFINSCVNNFMAQPAVYPSPESRVRYALGFIKGGSATRWRDGLFLDIAAGSYVFTSWEDFACRLRATFGNPHAVEDAQRLIKSVRQGRRTAQDFFIEFEELRTESRFCDAAVIFDLKQAVRADIREEANRRVPKPVTYAEWKAVIIQVDQDLRANSTDSTFFR